MMTAAAGVPPAGAARIVRVEERARFRCARCGETFADASSLVSHKVWHRKRDASSNAPVEEEHHRDGGVTGARGGPTRGHPSGVRRGNDVAGALTHAQRDLLREGEQLMRRLDTVRASTSFSSPSSSSSMGRLHATSRTSLAQRLRAEKEERARRDGIIGWTSPTRSPTREPRQQQPGTRPSAGGFDEEKSHEKGEDDEALETVAPPRRPVAPRYGSEVPDEPAARPIRMSSPHEAETIRYRDEDDDEDASPSSASSSTASFDSTVDAASAEWTAPSADDGSLFRPACAPIALRKAPGQIRREEAAARREAARAAARDAKTKQRLENQNQNQNGEARPGTREDAVRPTQPSLPRWQGGTVIRRDRTGGGGGGGGIRSGDLTKGDGDDAPEDDPRLNDPRWGDPGGRLLDRARAAAVKIATRELAREAKRLALKEKGAIDPVGARKGGRDRATAEGGESPVAIFDESGDDSTDEARGSGVGGFLARYRALVRERDVGVLREREEREARAREEEEWRSSRSDEEDEDEDEGEGGRDGRALRAVASNEEDESFVEELTPEEEDELAEFERLERQVAAEVGAA